MRIKKIAKKFIPSFLLSFYHYLLALIGAFLYGFPSKKIIIIGVTGTGGKSTVVEMTAEILEEAGYKTASLSSIKFRIGEKEWPNTLKMTMPGRFKLQKFIKKAVRAGCKYLVLEVTSEGVKQYRHRFINFDTAVFTNLSPEHIEAHGGFERYRKAKLKLFQKTKNIHIINLDDENAKYFLGVPAKRKIFFSLKKEMDSERFKVVRAENIKEEISGLSFTVKNIDFNLELLGSFNIDNALAAICVGLSQGISLEICKKALEKIKAMLGRMEVVIKEPFKVIVDYAHTPQSLKKVYETLNNLKPITYNLKPNLICVLGSCGGGRDKWKRPILGKLAAKYCGKIIITNEDPYDEDPGHILSMIKSGISNSQFSISNFYEILDRRKAIKKALELAKPGDSVIITGKGSEPWMCVADGKKVPWDDRKVVKECLIEKKFLSRRVAAGDSFGALG